ncbi:unnamed protein product [Spodoptera littoralis]|uniref:Cuticular protein n=1 Tax=Spodoptera littoralis TaxID=7109 RepID=A0A9P0N7N1_SPOLI|nr:unnamed protein product [Spodoptera littoralis]CAH1644405.1 unnamed protein product [Spodoptera littoralis]
MRFILLLALVAVTLAEEVAKESDPSPELKPEESAQPIRVHEDEHHDHYHDGLDLIRSRAERLHLHFDDHHHHSPGPKGPVKVDYKDDDISVPVVLRTSHVHPIHSTPNIGLQNKIIHDVYSPDYYQPTWILDYRYLKTGGRDYTRGPGGQILILPKDVKSKDHKEFPDYDHLIEHLRLSRLAEHSKYGKHGYGYGHHDDGHHYPYHDDHHDHKHHGHGHGHGHAHHHSSWKSGIY